MIKLLCLVMLQVSLAWGLNVQAATQSSLPINHLHEVNKDRQGIIVEMYTNGKGTYQAIIKTGEQAAVSTHPEKSYPPPRFSWLSSDLLKMDFGSTVGADVRSIFYSVKRNQVTGSYSFVKAVEPINEIVLCTGDDVYFQKLFGEGNAKIPLKLTHLSTAALKWFVISSETYFIDSKLYVKYMTDSSDMGGKEEWVSVETEIPTVLLQGK